MGKLIIITGPSGSGKSTLENKLVKDGVCTKLISFTTRNPRPTEQHKVDYYFFSKDEIAALEKEGKVVEKVTFGEDTYGLLAEEVESKLSSNNAVVVLEPHGVEIVKQYCKEKEIPHLLIVLTPPVQSVLQNLIARILRDSNSVDEIVKNLTSRLTVFVSTEVPLFYGGDKSNAVEYMRNNLLYSGLRISSYPSFTEDWYKHLLSLTK